MPRNEEGEFELVIGNRQLLSGFFIVVVLFGVLFAMGYIVGRHSSPTGPSAAAAVSETAPAASPSSSGPPAGRAEVVMAETKPADAPPAEAPAATRPATAPPEAPRPAESRPAEKPQPEPRAASKGPSDPPPGKYLQVAAPNRAAAGGVIESLKNKGITARLAPGPNEDTVRVLVGPLDAADVGKMKVDLQSAGYPAFTKTY